MSKRIHETLGNGRWFPADGDVLRRTLDDLLAAAPAAHTEGPLFGITVPHAHIRYSGSVAAAGFRALRDSWAGAPPPTVVILGFAHRGANAGLALLDADAVRSPLGTRAVDGELVDALTRAAPCIRRDSSPHCGEHSAENAIPFAQRAFPDSSLVVGLFGSHDEEAEQAVARALVDVHRERRIVVAASTDMLHDPDYDHVCNTDARTLQLLEQLDAPALRAIWSPREQCLCGIAPTLALMRAARALGARAGTPLAYLNSGDVDPAGRGHLVVGYGAVGYGVS